MGGFVWFFICFSRSHTMDFRMSWVCSVQPMVFELLKLPYRGHSIGLVLELWGGCWVDQIPQNKPTQTASTNTHGFGTKCVPSFSSWKWLCWNTWRSLVQLPVSISGHNWVYQQGEEQGRNVVFFLNTRYEACNLILCYMKALVCVHHWSAYTVANL